MSAVEATSLDDARPVTRGDLRRLERQLAELREVAETSRQRLLTPEGTGEAFGISTRKVYQLLADGMPCIYVGCQRRVIFDEALAWLREHGAGVGR